MQYHWETDGYKSHNYIREDGGWEGMAFEVGGGLWCAVQRIAPGHSINLGKRFISLHEAQKAVEQAIARRRDR